jgi:hypothetical protein
MKQTSIKLCCGKKGCPEVILDGSKIKITDDYGNTVTMSDSEAKLIGDAVIKLLK